MQSLRLPTYLRAWMHPLGIRPFLYTARAICKTQRNTFREPQAGRHPSFPSAILSRSGFMGISFGLLLHKRSVVVVVSALSIHTQTSTTWHLRSLAALYFTQHATNAKPVDAKSSVLSIHRA